MPVIGRRSMWKNKWAERDRHLSSSRQECLVAQNFPRAAYGNGANRPLGIHRRFECTQLKRPDTGHRGECSFRINYHRLAIFQGGVYLSGLPDTRLRVATIVGELTAARRQGADER